MKRILIIFVFAAILIGAIAFNIKARKPGTQPVVINDNANQELLVTTATARHQLIRQKLTLVGTIRAENSAVISSKVASKITTVLVKEGNTVTKGQVLIFLDSSDSVPQSQSAAAGVQAARAQYLKAIEGKRAKLLEMDTKILEAESAITAAESKSKQAKLGSSLVEDSIKADLEKAVSGVKSATAALELARSADEAARKALKRVQYLFEHGGATRIESDAAQSQAEATKSQVQQAVAGLEIAQSSERSARSTATLRRQSAASDVESSTAGLQQANLGLANAKKAKVDASVLADRDIESAKAAIQQASASQTGARILSEASVLTSPISGTVVDLNAHPGEFAQPGAPLMSIVGSGSCYLDASCPARQVSAIKTGQSVQVHLNQSPASVIEGEIAEIISVTSADGKNFPIKIRLKTSRKLNPGMLAKAVLELGRDVNSISVPLDAVRNEGNQEFVFVVSDGKAVRHDVTVGGTDGASAQIITGLKNGEVVVLTGPALLATGNKVKMVDR